MKRLLGAWTLEGHDSKNSKPETGELIIDGNDIEFYRQGGGEVFQSAFICRGGDLHGYKVIAQACRDSGTRKTLDYSSNYRVSYVLQQNCAFRPGINTDNIADCSFVIPELVDWLGVRLTELLRANENELLVKERIFQPIRLKDAEPRIEIVFESGTFDRSFEEGNGTTAVVNVQPRIWITYGRPVTIREIHRDIEFTMQFWGLMIGRVSVAQDICLTIKDQPLSCRLYLNHDYSYNLRTFKIDEHPRTNLKKIGNDIQRYFSTWYSFCCDEKYEFIRRMYFFTNNRSVKFAEDIFLQYVKILEGYSLRETNDETTAAQLEAAIKKSKKEIKHLIFTDTGKPLFAAALQEVLPEWKFTSPHADQIANWIATGYIGKRGLADRLRELDSMYLHLLTANASTIMQLTKDEFAVDKHDKNSDDEFLKKIVSTRNYLSHYKADKDCVLDVLQWDATINSLKALVIAILYSKMGMNNEVIRKILMWDSELHFQTMYLRKSGESEADCLSEKEGVLKEHETLTCAARCRKLFDQLLKRNKGSK